MKEENNKKHFLSNAGVLDNAQINFLGGIKMERKIIAIVTDEEKSNIEDLFEKKSAIENLIKILDGNSEILSKLVQEYTILNREFTNWWDNVYDKYNLREIAEGKNTYVNFASGEIYVL